MNQLSKNQIKDRLLKRAAKQWGYSDVDLENVFDPIVNLLFDVCAKELEKISNEIFSSRRRMTERLIDILTPTTSTKSTAARGILRAYPIDDNITLNDYHQFYFQKKELDPYNPSESLIKNYYFGPTKPVKLNRSKINYVVLPSGIQQVVKNQFKEVVSSKSYLEPLQHATIWIGIEHQGEGEINDLMLYFHQKNIDHRKLFFHFLPRAKWSLNNKPLKTVKGYNNHQELEIEESTLTQQDFHHLDRSQRQINDFFAQNFVTISDTINVSKDVYNTTPELEKIIPQEDLKKIKEEQLLWLKIEFPNVIGPEILSEIFCADNCFPVMNKKLNEIQGNIKDILNIYPLNLNDEFFLELFSVTNDKEKKYNITNTDDTSYEDYAFLRFGGVARFDERNATEEINYLIDLIRDEAAAFSRLGNDFTDNNLKEINQIISRLKNKIAQVGAQNANNPYLILNKKNKEEKGTVFVKYWTTSGENANKINAFSKFFLLKGSDFEKDKILLLSSTTGGKNELTNSEKIYAYRENLISNQKVVTRQDIIILCKNYFGNAVENIEIKNGIITSLDSNVGYLPTIDIYLSKSKSKSFNDEEWEFLKEDMQILIQNRAIDIVPIRIIYR